MKAIFVLFDTLNRRFLPPYGNDWVHAPNFKRLAEKTVIFDNCYSGSLPCMPARREHHSGRYNFLHRSWGPLEPFDESLPTILNSKGIYTHLVSDHYHYWEDGGATYHNRYESYELVRGHEGDLWKGEVKKPELPDHVVSAKEGTQNWRHDWINRKYMQKEEDMHQARTFKLGLEFIEKNWEEDNWFLQIETFDPHEPFFVPQKYKDLYDDPYDGPHFDWPDYSIVIETPEQVEHIRKQYAASVSMCDNSLGKLLDIMDERDLWKDTMLIVTTDHGFLLGEKGYWGKMVPPIYNEIAHIPLFIWDPRIQKVGQKRNSLVQAIDIAPTFLEFFNIKRPKTMQGKPLKETIENDKKIRDFALFGLHGAHVNITDGKYVYMRGSYDITNKPLFEYTVMPTHMKGFFSLDSFKTAEIAEPFSFTKECRTMKLEESDIVSSISTIFGTLLFDLTRDPHQEHPIEDDRVEKQMIEQLSKLMKESDAPLEQFERLGIPLDGEVTEKHLRAREIRQDITGFIGDTEIVWRNKGKSMYSLFLGVFPRSFHESFNKTLVNKIKKENQKEIDENFLVEFVRKFIPPQYKEYVDRFIIMVKQKAR
jgi:arylsulfatase A-like enzyme